jgi:hypothetical protein
MRLSPRLFANLHLPLLPYHTIPYHTVSYPFEFLASDRSLVRDERVSLFLTFFSLLWVSKWIFRFGVHPMSFRIL